MDQAKCLELIEFYKQHDLLWNPRNRMYHNKNKRQHAWCEISSLMNGTPIPELKTKMKTLMGTFRSEKSKEKKSNITGTGSQDAYTSKWFAYKSFEFLMDRNQPRETVDTEENQATEEPMQPSLVSLPLVSPPPSGDIASSDNEATPAKTTAKRVASKRRREPGYDDQRMQEASQVLRGSVPVANDPCYSYGMYIANELRMFDQRTQAYIKRDIADIFFKAEMGTIHLPPAPTVLLPPCPHGRSSAASTSSSSWNEECNTNDYSNL
ncbi:hypothetical protein HHI36_011002 [Cryptolaemus montrouzieri]|uniref:MADF domain-containing protein n=1 Tax=Cryptolaemus montrouzieri TaxID=559131 RepID=A0ABD2MKG1_9CUCU